MLVVDHILVSFHANRLPGSLRNPAVALLPWVGLAISAAQSIYVMAEIAPHEVVSTTS